MSASRGSDNLSDLCNLRKASKPADLDALAKQLDPAGIEHERKLRRELKAVAGRLRKDRLEMGRILVSYRAIYKPKGRWGAFCKAVGLKERSALRIIADYTAAKALPEAIREAATSRGIDIAAMKHRPLLEKLIDLGFEDGANADDLIQQGLDELEAKKKSQKPVRSFSQEQRFGKAYDTFVSLNPDVNSPSYLDELTKLYKALKSLYRGPTKKALKALSGPVYYSNFIEEARLAQLAAQTTEAAYGNC